MYEEDMSWIEKLPVKIIYEEKEYWLRIKPREKGKKWIIRYLGKRKDERKEKYVFAAKVRGFTYKTLVQFFGNDLESTAARAYMILQKEYNIM